MNDRALLYEAIYAHPDEDTPRLMLADHLDEHGEPARAELIRIQCEWIRDPRKELAERESVILREYGREWRRARRGPRCIHCGGTGEVMWPSEDGGSPPLKCPDCDRGRVAGFVIPNPQYIRGMKRITAALEAVGSRGEDACPTCDGRKTERYTDAAGDVDERACPTCEGRGLLFGLFPTDWARLVCTAHPDVTEIAIPSLTPHADGGCWRWYNPRTVSAAGIPLVGPPTAARAAIYSIYEHISDYTAAADGNAWKAFATAEAARLALYRAVPKFVRADVKRRAAQAAKEAADGRA